MLRAEWHVHSWRVAFPVEQVLCSGRAPLGVEGAARASQGEAQGPRCTALAPRVDLSAAQTTVWKINTAGVLLEKVKNFFNSFIAVFFF